LALTDKKIYNILICKEIRTLDGIPSMKIIRVSVFEHNVGSSLRTNGMGTDRIDLRDYCYVTPLVNLCSPQSCPESSQTTPDDNKIMGNLFHVTPSNLALR
jgi:hypothetical protein